MSYKYLLNIALLFINLNVFCQINFEAKLSKSTLGVNERLRVEFSINEDGDNFSAPDFINFKVVGGPSQSIKNSWVNGDRSYSKSYTYFLSPIKIGTYSIGQATIEVEGKVYKTLPLEIKVVGAVKNPNKENDPNYVSDTEIYLTSEISKRFPYLNEGFSVVYKLYFSSNIGITNWRELSSPRYTDFWSQNIDIDNYTIEEGTYKGKPSRYVILKKTVLYPQKEGELTIEPLSLDITLQIPTNRRDFFGQRITKSSQKVVTSGDQIISVKQLPNLNKPKDYKGAVGSFNFVATTSKRQLSVSEALELELEIKGNGNLKLFQLPKLSLPSSLEIYEPEKTENISTNISGMRGSIRDIYTIVPSKPGKYKIPKIEFSYFDINSKKYKTISSNEINIDVDGEEWGSEKDKNINSKIKPKNTTLKFLPFKTKSKFVKIKTKSFFNTNIFWGLLILPFIITILIIILMNYLNGRNKFLNTNIFINSRKLAKKYLLDAKSKLGSKKEFYESLDRALHNYLKSITLFDNSNYSKINIQKELEKRNIDANIIKALNQLFSNCEMARYTPITNVEMESDYKTALDIIAEIDKSIN
ncbi:BatD family protein [Flavobacteriaceae bacterium]|nr:BatD family protein [Flavobacteriaceae bacterium]